MKYVNLTPHQINVHKEDGSILSVDPSGQLARVASETSLSHVVDGVGFYATTYGDVEGLPDPVDGVVYIVSGMVNAQCEDRSDVVSPGELVRDDAGRPVGCRGLKP